MTHCRNLALSPTTPHKQIEDLMDAINHLPEMLACWESFDEQTMLLHFATYDEEWSRLSGEFSIRQTYSDLKRYGVVY